MTRKKVKLAFIPNDSSRKATFKKRKKGFLKKMYELTTLCEIEACAVIYSPYDAQPETWPSVNGAQRILSKFKRMPEMEKRKKMVNHEVFLRQRITKATEQHKKQQKENREKEISQIMHDCLGGKASVQNINMVELNDLGWLIDQNLKKIYKRIETLKKKPPPPKAPKRVAALVEAALPPLPPSPPHTSVNGGENMQQCLRVPPGFDQVNNMILDNQDAMMIHGSWFMDLMGPQDPFVGGLGGYVGGNGGGTFAENITPMTFADYSSHNLISFWSNNAFFP